MNTVPDAIERHFIELLASAIAGCPARFPRLVRYRWRYPHRHPLVALAQRAAKNRRRCAYFGALAVRLFSVRHGRQYLATLAQFLFATLATRRPPHRSPQIASV